MKKVMLVIVLFSFIAGLRAQPGNAAKSEIGFKDVTMEMAYNNYLELKDALVASKAPVAKEAAEKLKTSLALIKGGKNAVADAAKIANASSLEEIRRAFALLSIEMTTLVKGGQLSTGMLYVAYCPMANSNAGAYWLCSEKEIKNPYFGDKMLKCGSIKEMIH